MLFIRLFTSARAHTFTVAEFTGVHIKITIVDENKKKLGAHT